MILSRLNTHSIQNTLSYIHTQIHGMLYTHSVLNTHIGTFRGCWYDSTTSAKHPFRALVWFSNNLQADYLDFLAI